MSHEISRLQHGLTRREFTVESILALLAGVTITVSGCGSSSPTSPSPTPPPATAQDVPGTISANHGHIATVRAVDITAAKDVTLDIQGNASHKHVVTLTADQVRAVGNRTQVSVQSSNDAGHVHTVTFN